MDRWIDDQGELAKCPRTLQAVPPPVGLQPPPDHSAVSPPIHQSTNPSIHQSINPSIHPSPRLQQVRLAAGLLAAKNTPNLLPLCHPLPLDQVTVGFHSRFLYPGVRVRCEASTTAKTGVEMEALHGCVRRSSMRFTISSNLDPVLEISNIRLEYKSGGKKGYWTHPKTKTPPKAAKPPRLGNAVVITVSDRVSADR